MAVLASATNGGPVGSKRVASLTWGEPTTVEVETCGRSFWSFLQRSRAIDNKQLANVSAFQANAETEEEASARLSLAMMNFHPVIPEYRSCSLNG